MSNTPAPSIFEAINARALEPHQVAQTFVPSRHYGELARPAHTLVVGPRGSGKTTLLKMLQQSALEAWHHPQADEYRQNVTFTGVFIATDVSWREQIQSLGHGSIDEEHSRYLTNAAFTTHFLRALVAAMERKCRPLQPDDIGHLRVELPPAQQEIMARQLSSSWYLEPALYTLLGIKYALSNRLSLLREIGSREALLGPKGRSERLGNIHFLHTDFLEAAGHAVEMFDDLTAGGSGRWALLFDELELAPSWILQKLIASLRSANDKFLFKLSMSPFNQDVTMLEHALSAMPDNDYTVVPLWYAHKEEGYAFSADLLKTMLSAKRITGATAEDLFGRSEFETGRDEWAETGTAYHPGARLQHRFSQLADNDASFSRYLKRKGIKPDLSNIPIGDARAADVRKITSIVAVRNAFRMSDAARERGTRERIRRSRKNSGIYAGATALFAMSEGNPRWLKGILGRLIGELSDVAKPIDRGRQNREVLNAAHRFRALLRTIPGPSVRHASIRGLLSILDRIGEYFFAEIVLADFNPEPPSSFTVDSRSSDDLLDGLAKALNAGAIVYVPEDSSQLLLGSLRGKRFRLSYLLAAYYQTSLTLGKSQILSSILSRGAPRPLLDDVGGSDANN